MSAWIPVALVAAVFAAAVAREERNYRRRVRACRRRWHDECDRRARQ